MVEGAILGEECHQCPGGSDQRTVDTWRDAPW